MASESYEVKVYIYDLSRGMARAMSQAFLGKQIDGIWHTGIVVYGEEYFYGGMGGIECCPPGGTIMGQPDTIKSLGKTQIPKDMFLDYLRELSQTSYRPSSYHLLDHNCNTFSSELAQFLTGNDIPSHITGLPSEVLSTPFGQMIRPMIDAMSVQPSGGHALFSDTPPPTSNQKPSSTAPPASRQATTSVAKQSTSDIKPYVFKENLPPVTQWTSDGHGLSSSDKTALTEIYEFLGETEPSWSLGRNHLAAVVRLALDTHHGEQAVRLLAHLLTNREVLQVLKHDPNTSFSHLLEKYEDFTSSLKVGIVKMACNCCATPAGRQVLLGDRLCPLITRVSVSCLCADNMTLSSAGLALSYNLCADKWNEDTELEVGSALLNCFGKPLIEEQAFHLLTAVHELSKRNAEVRGLASVLSVDVGQYKPLSERVASLCDKLQTLIG